MVATLALFSMINAVSIFCYIQIMAKRQLNLLLYMYISIKAYFHVHLSIVAGLVVRHGDLSHEITLSHSGLGMIHLIECDKSHVSLPSCNN